MSYAIRRANSGTTKDIISVNGDGNCFFRAVILACNHKNINAFPFLEEDHRILRTMVVDFAKNRKYNFSVYNIEYSSKTEWISEMIKNGTWADNVAIEATSDLLAIPIHIFNSNGRIITKFGSWYRNWNPITGIDNIIRLQLDHGHYSIII